MMKYRHEYYLKNKERIKEAHKQYYLKNREKIKEKLKNKVLTPEEKSRAVKRSYKLRDKKIQWLLEFYGTTNLHCDRCGYDKSFAALQFHHVTPSQKENVKDSFSKWLRKYSFDKFCSLIISIDLWVLCANCHAEYHAGLWESLNGKPNA